MPRPTYPPTPSSSTTFQPKSLDGNNFRFEELPPPAMTGRQPGTVGLPSPSSSPRQNYAVTTSASPSVPKATIKPLARRRTSSGAATNPPTMTNFANSLPPPPTRSRKIIQVKPAPRHAMASSSASASATSQENADGSTSPTVTPAKRKTAPTPTSAAGRKIARKTAHSLIERRRRSKMNEEFGVLKGMIPACQGVEMHKLAILQASIEYLRYLEDCVNELKGTRGDNGPSTPFQTASTGASPGGRSDLDDDSSNDGEVGDYEAVQPPREEQRRSKSSSSSPSVSGAEYNSTAPPSVYAASPQFGATISPSIYPHFNSSMTLTSPSLPPQLRHASQASTQLPPPTIQLDNPVDAEAGHALMLLGSASGESSASQDRRGMRVKDLLSF
jgi:hypothetical protein